MSVKGVEHYFDWSKFCQGKQFTVTAVGPWKDHDSGRPLGTKVEVAITVDKVPYLVTKDGRELYNMYEKLVWKIGKAVNFSIGAVVTPVGATVTLWSRTPNGPKDQMSVKVTDIKVAQPAAGSTPNHATATAPGKSLG